MKLVLLFGNGAVGKMTVGQALAGITSLRLFHNHMTIEPVIEVFGAYNGHVTERLREVIFEEFAASGQYGMIFTFMWAFDQPSDWDYVAHVKAVFRQRAPDAEFYHVELVAPQAVRLARNATENRLLHKASKRDVALSNSRVVDMDTRYRCESLPGEIPFENYLRIDNSALSAEDAARRIREHFGL